MRYFCLLFLLFLADTARGQDNASLEQFSIYQVKQDAYLYWILTTGSSCNGIGIQRSEDSIQFNEIYTIAGVCGNVSSPTAFNYTDASPLVNRKAYYRLRLGNAGYSQTVSVTIYSTAEMGYLVLPNPVSTNCTIYFDNPKKQEVEIIIYSSAGHVVSQTLTHDDFFKPDINSMRAGLYFFSLLSGTANTTGKILVVK